MRKSLTLVLAGTLGLLLSGCTLFNHVRPNNNNSVTPPPSPDQKPTTTSLVNYLNQNAKRIQSVKGNLEIDARMAGQSIPSVSGGLVARRPRDLRIRARLLGQPAVDLGSNEKEFWYWVGRQKDDYYYRCSYGDLATGKVNVPFPVEVDMVMAALNMAEYDPKGKYDLAQGKDNTWELTQETTSAAGQQIKRVTVFRGTMAAPGEPQVLEHAMRDVRNGLICRATVQKVQNERGATVPTKVVIEYPAQKARMTLLLSGLSINAVDAGDAARAFTIEGVGKDVFDLARGAVVSPSSHRRAENDKRR